MNLCESEPTLVNATGQTLGGDHVGLAVWASPVHTRPGPSKR